MSKRSICRGILVLVGIFIAAVSLAGTPDPTHSIVPTFIRVGGATGLSGLPDPSIATTITLRDAASNPLVGETVTLDFTGCTDTRLCTATVGVNCPTKTVTGTTNAAGQVSFSVMGINTMAGTGTPVGPGAGAGCVTIKGGSPSVILGKATAVTYDLVSNGVSAVDLSLAVSEVMANIAANPEGSCGPGPLYRGRIDYKEDGVINGSDLAAYLDIVGRSNAGSGSGAGCAAGGTVQPYCP